MPQAADNAQEVTYRRRMLRFALHSRWIPWHVMCIVLISLLIAAGVWQWNVAFDDESGVNMRNLVYAIQWWIFTAFGAWFWWRFLRDQRDAELAAVQEAAANAPDGQMGPSAGSSASAGSSGQASQDIPISLEGSADERRARARGRQFESGQGPGQGE